MESNLGHPDDVTEGVLDGMAHHGSGSVAGDDVNLLEILNKCKKVVQRFVDFVPSCNLQTLIMITSQF